MQFNQTLYCVAGCSISLMLVDTFEPLFVNGPGSELKKPRSMCFLIQAAPFAMRRQQPWLQCMYWSVRRWLHYIESHETRECRPSLELYGENPESASPIFIKTQFYIHWVDFLTLALYHLSCIHVQLIDVFVAWRSTLSSSWSNNHKDFIWMLDKRTSNCTLTKDDYRSVHVVCKRDVWINLHFINKLFQK